MATVRLADLAETLQRIRADLAELERHRDYADPLDWWFAGVGLLDAMQTVVDAIQLHPHADATGQRFAADLIPGVRMRYHQASCQYHLLAAARHGLLAGPSPHYQLFHRSVPTQIVDHVKGTFSSLTDAMRAAGHTDPADWTSEAPDVIVGTWTEPGCSAPSAAWRIRGYRAAREHLDLLTADVEPAVD